MTTATQLEPAAPPPPAVLATTHPREALLAASAASLASQVDRVPVVIEDEETAAAATALDKLLKDTKKGADDCEAELTGPWKALAKSAKARFDGVRAVVAGARATLDARLRAWELAKKAAAEARAAEVRRSLEEAAMREGARAEAIAVQAAAEGDDELAASAAKIADASLDTAVKAGNVKAAPAPTRGTLGGTSFLTEFWDLEVIDLAQVPEDFLMPRVIARAKVLEFARREEAAGRVPVVPGVRVFKDHRRTTRG